MTAISRILVDIYIVAADTAPSALTDADIIKGEITNYSKSGGEDDVETVNAFGGDIDKEKPQSQMEIEFEVTPAIEDADRWDAYIYGKTNGVFVANKSVGDRAIYIHAKSGGTHYSWAFNNCNSVSWDWDHSADDNLSGNFTFKLSPQNRAGISNYMSASSAVTSLPNWSTLDGS
jgi:hypothetical protein